MVDGDNKEEGYEDAKVIEDGVEEIVTGDTNDVEEVEVEHLDEDLYPTPPQNDPEVTKRMERRKEPTSK